MNWSKAFILTYVLVIVGLVSVVRGWEVVIVAYPVVISTLFNGYEKEDHVWKNISFLLFYLLLLTDLKIGSLGRDLVYLIYPMVATALVCYYSFKIQGLKSFLPVSLFTKKEIK